MHGTYYDPEFGVLDSRYHKAKLLNYLEIFIEDK